MAGPFDYTSAFADVGSAYDATVKGMKDGVAIQQLQAESAAAQAKAAQQAAMRAKLAELAKNPTTQGIIAATIEFPELSENFKRTFDMLEPQEQKAQISQGLPVFTALNNNQPEVAIKVLREQAQAYRNSGRDKDAAAAEATAKQIEENPGAAKVTIGGMLSAAIGADKFSKIIGEQGAEARAAELQPDLVRSGKAAADKAGSEAQIKGVEAKYADQNALRDYELKGWNIEAIKADNEYKRKQTQIGFLNAKIARERNEVDRERLELEREKVRTERDEKVRAKLADAESGAASIDNMLNNIERILNVAEETKDGKRTGEATALLRAAAGPLDSRIPTVQSDVADLEALVETLGAQAFLSQIPNIKGMGALSNAEGEKLQSAFQNFSLKQSPKQVIANLKEAQRLLNNGRGAISKRYGVPLPAADTPARGSSLPAGWSVEVN